MRQTDYMEYSVVAIWVTTIGSNTLNLYLNVNLKL